MEKRAILAAALMALVLIVYQVYFVPVSPPVSDKSTEGKPASAPASPAPASQPAAPAPPVPPPAPRPARQAPRPPQRTATVETPHYRAVVSSEGAKLQDWTLHYRGDKPMVAVGEFGPTGLAVGPVGAAGAPVPMTLSADRVVVSRPKTAGELVLAGEVDGLRVRQTLRFSADTFALETAIRVENASGTPRPVTIALPWEYRHHATAPPEKFNGQRPTEVVWSTGTHVERIEALADVGSHVVDGAWIAMGSTWYLAAIVPKSPGFQLTAASEPKGESKNGEYRVTVAARANPTIAAGQAWEGQVVLYVGPKEYDRLEAYGLEGTLNFGGFPLPRRYGGLPMEWLGVPILKLMNWVYRHVGNYGVAIILLTVISKVLFYPLTVKSLRSMKAMQALQPQVNALRSKYKSDPRKLQEETLALYRKYKVNPMGGCLPMVAQVPIFYALYLALSVSVELQNAPFLCLGRLWGVDLWICDLAGHDPTYVMPILMGISMFVQQKMSPTMGDPRQAKMMLFMPVVFTFMFLNLPSGLVLYWFVSNVLQILQQWYMNRSAGGGAARESRDAARA
jgi:YidC/Oxa1 family membrane protein insertase